MIKAKEGMIRNEALIKARKQCGLTQQELADVFKFRKSTICNWENGRSHPRMKEAIILTKILNKTVEELFHDIIKAKFNDNDVDLPDSLSDLEIF